MPRKNKTEAPPANIWGKILTGDANEYLPLFEFAKQLKLGEEYLIGLAKSGRLKAFKIDDYWLSTATWIKEWLDEVKNNIHQEIGGEPAEIRISSETPIAAKALAVKPVRANRAKAKNKPSFVLEIEQIRSEVLEEIEKEEHAGQEKKWVNHLGDKNSFRYLLNMPLKLALVPKRASVSHYALVLALFLILASGLFIYTAARAGF